MRATRGAGPQVKEREIIEYLNHNGFKSWRNQSGAVRVKGGSVMHLAPKGTSDVIGFQKTTGLIVAIERKRPGEEISPEQQEFIQLVLMSGGYAGIATCLDDVQKIIFSEICHRHAQETQDRVGECHSGDSRGIKPQK